MHVHVRACRYACMAAHSPLGIQHARKYPYLPTYMPTPMCTTPMCTAHTTFVNWTRAQRMPNTLLPVHNISANQMVDIDRQRQALREALTALRRQPPSLQQKSVYMQRPGVWVCRVQGIGCESGLVASSAWKGQQRWQTLGCSVDAGQHPHPTPHASPLPSNSTQLCLTTLRQQAVFCPVPSMTRWDAVEAERRWRPAHDGSRCVACALYACFSTIAFSSCASTLWACSCTARSSRNV